jgi:hypothetical protein
VTDLKADLTKKADPDGYYEDMTVGNAEQLVSTQYHEDATPYNYRTTGGSADVGNREYVDAIVGGTVAWNQLIDITGISRTVTSNGITMVINNGVAVFNGTAETTKGAFEFWYRVNKHETIVGHVYMYWINKVSGAHTGTVNFVLEGVGNVTTGAGTTPRIKKAVIVSDRCDCYIGEGTSTDYTLRFQSIDLTQMFGSTIADYIYSLEQATEGAGVAWFRRLFPKDYYEYNPGELKSVSGLISHDMIGFNLWDEDWESGDLLVTSNGVNHINANRIRSKGYVRVMPDTTYCITCPHNNTIVAFYDENKEYPYNTQNVGWVSKGNASQGGTFVTPIWCRYIRFYADSTTYNHDICINLSDPKRNGQYEPYHKRSYPLDSTLTLRGIPKLDASNNLFYDGDRYLPDGTVERRYGIVDLGTLNWYLWSNDANTFTSSFVKISNSAHYILCAKYPALINNSTVWSVITNYDKIIYKPLNGAFILCRDTSYTDAATFKAAMSGVYLVYELATPTTETAQPYQEVQICDDLGTEEFVLDNTISVPVPVGHSTRYHANLRDKLQHLPNLASADGYYMINQTGSQMNLEPFRIPKAPTTDGAYTLKATVSGGTPTYTWESES